jgi:hypothetical protein
MTTTNTTKTISARKALRMTTKAAKATMNAAFRTFKRVPSAANWDALEALSTAFQNARFDLAIYNEINPVIRPEEVTLSSVQ